ncbi:MAG: hypothetical protein WC480_03080 [Patescibacteria group bacterium]
MPFTNISLFYDDLRKNLKVIFLQDRILIIFFGIALVLNLLLYFGLYWQIQPSAEPVFLHYNIYFGIDLIGGWQEVYLMPIVGSFLLVINLILAYFFYHSEKIVSYLLLGISLLIEVLLLVGGVMVIMVNQ